MRSVLGFSGGKAVARINAPANRVAWSSRHRPENHRTRRALIVAVVTGCIAPGLKQLEPSVLMVLKYISILVKFGGHIGFWCIITEECIIGVGYPSKVNK